MSDEAVIYRLVEHASSRITGHHQSPGAGILYPVLEAEILEEVETQLVT